MKIYRLVMTNKKTKDEIFFAKYKTKTLANAALRTVKRMIMNPEVEVYILEAELLEEKKK